MKKYILILIAIIYTENIIAQCSLTFEEINNSTNYSLSNFDTFALRKGYTYNSQKDAYICDTEFKNGAHAQLFRKQSENGGNVIQNIFFSKESYLNYKEYLESKGNLSGQEAKNNEITLQYVFDNRLVLLQTKTLNGITFYCITISNERL